MGGAEERYGSLLGAGKQYFDSLRYHASRESDVGVKKEIDYKNSGKRTKACPHTHLSPNKHQYEDKCTEYLPTN